MCVKGCVRDRETAIGLDGIIFLGVRLDLAAARNLDVAISPNRRILDRACLDLAATLDGEIFSSFDALILGSLGGDGSTAVDCDVAAGPDAVRITRGVDVA